MKPKKPLYEKFTGEDLKIAERIQQLRNEMLVHSYLYYVKDTNIISDSEWAARGKKLEELQNQYPKIASKVPWAKEFEEWDASSGAHLPLDNDWVVQTGERLLYVNDRTNSKKN